VALVPVAFHDGAGGHFFRSLAIAPRALGRFLDVFVLALFLGANSAEMFASGHNLIPSLMALLFLCVPTASSDPAEEQ
jgi:hypothetical protein